MASREFVMVVEESAYKVPVVSPTVWTTSSTFGLANAAAYYPRLDGDNAMTMRPRPSVVGWMYGGGVATPAGQISDKTICTGQLRMKLSLLQSPFWLSWAGVQINAGQTAPWVTTLPAGDLPSCSVYHGIVEPDGTIKRRVYLGTKVDNWALAVSEGSTVATLTLNLTASTPQGNQFDSSSDPSAGTFPVPADNNLPSDWYTFIMAGGASFVTIGGAVRTQFTELSINSSNVLSKFWYANRYLNTCQYVGRTTTVGTKMLYPASGQDDRAHYEGLISESVSVKLNNGTHGVTFGFNAQNIFGPFEDDLSMAQVYFQSSTSNNMYDPAAGSDFTMTFA
jgi:hypothetical protein